MVIDELIVVLGLDSSKFTEGQRDALAAFKKTREGADVMGKDVEAQGMKLSEVFGTLKKGLLGIVGGFAGFEAASIVNKINSMDAATGRWAKTIDGNVQGLSTWQGMIRQIGGEAAAATSALSTLQQEINSVRQGGGMFEGGFASLMNQSGASIRDDANTVLRKVQAFIAGQVESGKMKPADAATYLRRVPGMNQDMVNLMLGDFKKIEQAARAAGTATKESADEAIRYQESLNQLSLSAEGLERVLVNKLTPSIVSFLDRTKQIIQELGEGKIVSPDSFLGRLMSGPVGREVGSNRATRLGHGPHPSSPPPETSSGGGGWLSGLYGFVGNIPSALKSNNAARLGHGPSGGAHGVDAQPPPGAEALPGPQVGRRSRGDRNNNPGNIEYGTFARAHGATGTDGRFAIFPDPASGESAMADLLMKSYSGLTLAQIQRKWVGNEDPGYLGSMSRATGLGAGDVPNLGDASVRQKLISGMARGEGSQVGARGAAAARGVERSSKAGSTSTSTSSTTIGQIVLPGVKDADDFAREIEPAIRRNSMVAPINYGLV